MGKIIDFASFKNNEEIIYLDETKMTTAEVSLKSMKADTDRKIMDFIGKLRFISGFYDAFVDEAKTLLLKANIPCNGYFKMHDSVYTTLSKMFRNPDVPPELVIEYYDQAGIMYMFFVSCNTSQSKFDSMTINIMLTKNDAGYVYVRDFPSESWEPKYPKSFSMLPDSFVEEAKQHTAKGRLAQFVGEFMLPSANLTEKKDKDDYIIQTCEHYEPFEPLLKKLPNHFNITLFGKLYLTESAGREGNGIAIGIEDDKYTINQFYKAYDQDGNLVPFANTIATTGDIEKVCSIVSEAFKICDPNKQGYIFIPVSLNNIIACKDKEHLSAKEIIASTKGMTLTKQETEKLNIFCEGHNALFS